MSEMLFFSSSSSEGGDEESDLEESMTLAVWHQGETYHFSINSNAFMQKFHMSVAKKFGIQESSLCLLFDGESLELNKTMKQLELESGDLLEAIHR